MDRVGAIVPAAGRSERMEGLDKLLAPLAGRPLLAWCVETLESSALVTEIVVSVSPEKMFTFDTLVRTRKWDRTRLVSGGRRRQDSVANALEVLNDVDWVIVHDGDRPFLTEALIRNGLSAARETGVAVAAVTLKDTVKVVSPEGVVRDTLDRSTLRAVQTPQMFRADIIRDAYTDIGETVTDDAMLAERRGYSVTVYEGLYENLKVTTPDDLLVAQVIARRWEAGR